MSRTTREQMLETARMLFAERGFYGVSIANIADEHGLTKQALLHHFGSKEKIYGEVLKAIAEELNDLMTAVQAGHDDPQTQLTDLFGRMASGRSDDVIRTRLLMRELLDNKHRAQTAGAWYLKPFLKSLTNMAKAIPGWSHAADAQIIAVLYQIIGAVSYYGVSAPTLRGIYGKAGAQAIERAFPAQLEATIAAALAARPIAEG
ncbi:MAG: TetR/AcrR family transcriptional regulator [Pseudomonadota bacterium]